MANYTEAPRATDRILDFYGRPAAMTSAGRFAPLFDQLPRDVAGLTRVVQGLLLHEFAADWYGVSLSDERRSESHIRPVERMLERLLALDDRPLSVARPPERRLVGVCRHFVVLLLAMLRAKGVPARGRCGFGSYFNPGYFEDHVVCEYWNAAEARWALADPQFDEVWRTRLKIEHDVLDVPRDRFVIASDAWKQCRAGEADPSRFGIFKGDLRGSWFVANSLVRDVGTLNKAEMLPWDVWGAMSRQDERLNDDRLAFFDRLATLTRAPDESFEELRGFFEQDERLRVPATVFNAILKRPEAL
jgi:hypothetical protein